MSTKPPGTPSKVPGSHPKPGWCRPCSPSRWLRERYLSPSSSRITGREIFITTTHCGQLRGVTWKMSCRVERIGHVSREAGGIFHCFKDCFVWQRLREGHPRYKEGGSRQPKQEDFFRVCHDPRWLLAKMSKKICSSPLLQMGQVRHKVGLCVYVLTGALQVTRDNATSWVQKHTSSEAPLGINRGIPNLAKEGDNS